MDPPRIDAKSYSDADPDTNRTFDYCVDEIIQFDGRRIQSNPGVRILDIVKAGARRPYAARGSATAWRTAGRSKKGYMSAGLRLAPVASLQRCLQRPSHH